MRKKIVLCPCGRKKVRFILACRDCCSNKNFPIKFPLTKEEIYHIWRFHLSSWKGKKKERTRDRELKKKLKRLEEMI